MGSCLGFRAYSGLRLTTCQHVGGVKFCCNAPARNDDELRQVQHRGTVGHTVQASAELEPGLLSTSAYEKR